MTWDEFKAELLDFMGRRVAVDVVFGPLPVVGFEGVLVNASEGRLDGDPDKPVSVCLRIRADGSTETTRVESYLNLFEAHFDDASWDESEDGRMLSIELTTGLTA